MTKGMQGFASMESEKLSEVASKGGKKAHETGKAHEFTPEEARENAYKSHLSRQKNKQAKENLCL